MSRPYNSLQTNLPNSKVAKRKPSNTKYTFMYIEIRIDIQCTAFYYRTLFHEARKRIIDVYPCAISILLRPCFALITLSNIYLFLFLLWRKCIHGTERDIQLLLQSELGQSAAALLWQRVTRGDRFPIQRYSSHYQFSIILGSKCLKLL